MASYSVKFKTRRVGGHGKGSSNAWTAKILPNRTVDQMELAALIEKENGLSATTVNHVLTCVWLKSMELLRKGCNVRLEGVRLSLQATGTLPYENSPFDPERNSVVVRATTTGTVRDAPRTKQGSQEAYSAAPLLEPVNVLPPPPATTNTSNFSVMDGSLRKNRIITVPSMIFVSGRYILMTPGMADEGVWFVSHVDGSTRQARILANTPVTIDMELDDLPPAGECTMLIRARNGDPVEYAPREIRCVVTISPAATSSSRPARRKRRP